MDFSHYPTVSHCFPTVSNKFRLQRARVGCEQTTEEVDRWRNELKILLWKSQTLRTPPSKVCPSSNVHLRAHLSIGE